MVVVKDGEGAGLDEGQDHVDQLRGGGVAPVVVLQRTQHLATLREGESRFRYNLASPENCAEVTQVGFLRGT